MRSTRSHYIATDKLASTPRALVLDDEPFVLSSISRILSRGGFRVDGAKSLAECKALVDRHEYDLLLVDVQLTGENGLTLCETVMGVRKRPLVIVVTGGGSMEEVANALWLNRAHMVLLKPFTGTELLTLARRGLHCSSFFLDPVRLMTLRNAFARYLGGESDNETLAEIFGRELLCMETRSANLVAHLSTVATHTSIVLKRGGRSDALCRLGYALGLLHGVGGIIAPNLDGLRGLEQWNLYQIHPFSGASFARRMSLPPSIQLSILKQFHVRSFLLPEDIDESREISCLTEALMKAITIVRQSSVQKSPSLEWTAGNGPAARI